MILPDGRTLVIPLALTAALISLITLGVLLLEPYTYTAETAPSPEVRRNPFEALDRWKEAANAPYRPIRVEQLPAPLNGPSRAAVFLLAAPWYNAPPFPRTELHQWVEQGGHLVLYNISPEQTGKPPLAELLEPSKISLEGSGIPEDLSGAGHWYYRGGCRGKTALTARSARPAAAWRIPPKDREERLRRSPFTVISLPPDKGPPPEIPAPQPKDNSSDDWEIRMITLPYGQGQITLSTGAEFLTNSALDKEDNAALAWTLTRGRTIHLHTDREALPGTPYWRQKRFLGLLIPLLLLLAVLLWRQGRQFGPRHPPEVPPSDQFSRRFLAEGLYLWKTEKGFSYVENGRREILRLHRKSSNRSPGGLAPSLAAPPPKDLSRKEFIRTMQTYLTLKEGL